MTEIGLIVWLLSLFYLLLGVVIILHSFKNYYEDNGDDVK